jgi:hypothetical protein
MSKHTHPEKPQPRTPSLAPYPQQPGRQGQAIDVGRREQGPKTETGKPQTTGKPHHGNGK